MKLILLPADKYIREHASKKVTNPQVFSGKSPTTDGLLSPDIFGRTPDEKKVLTGYIELNKKYIHPVVYSAYFRRRMRDVDDIIAGKKLFIKTSDGDMVPTEDEDNENAGTGIDWLYKNYIGMKLKGSEENDSDSILTAGIKKSMSRLHRNEVFQNKVIVIPLIYRDINTESTGMIKLDELNAIYQKIISLDRLIRDNVDIALVDTANLDLRMQQALVELYDYFTKKIFGKDGIQRRYTMGRKVDYAARSIISGMSFEGKFGSHPLGLSRAGYPLSTIADTGILIMLYHLESTLRYYTECGYFEGCSVQDCDDYFTSEVMTDMINLYSSSWGERCTKVTLEKDGVKIPLNIPITLANGETIKRDISITELLYIVAYPHFEQTDMFMMISRYPIMDDKNIAITKIHVLTTIKTEEVIIDGLKYPYYPSIGDIEEFHQLENPIELEKAVSLMFHETVKMSNTFLKGFDADYDGDKMALRLIMSASAIAEASAKLKDPMSMFSLNGSLIKHVGDEAIQCLYSFSINPKADAKEVDSSIVDDIISKDVDSFDPDYIFKECGMAKLKSGQKNKHYDIVTVPKGFMGLTSDIESTLGRLLINKIIFSRVEGLKYINQPFNKKTVMSIFDGIRDSFLYKKIDFETLERVIIVYEDFGFRMASFIVPSLDVTTMIPSKAFKAKREELFNTHKEELANDNIFVAKDIEKEMIEMAKKEYSDLDYMEWYDSGASGKMNYGADFKVANIFVGTMPKSIGGGFSVSTSNLIDGMKPREIHLAASQLLLGAFNRAKKTAVGGYYAKQAIQIFESLRASKFNSDCKTTDGLEFLIDNPMDYLGRYTLTGVKLTPDNISEYIGKVVKLRTPCMCDGDDLCSKCVGDIPYELLNSYDNPIVIGLFINKFFTELTQKALKKSHDISAKLGEVGDLNGYFIEEKKL